MVGRPVIRKSEEEEDCGKSSQPEQVQTLSKPCFLCSRNIKFSKKSQLYRHYITHQDLKDKLKAVNGNSVTCSVCKIESRSVNTTLRHFGFAHNWIEELIPEHAKFDKLKHKTTALSSETDGRKICKVGFSCSTCRKEYHYAFYTHPKHKRQLHYFHFVKFLWSILG